MDEWLDVPADGGMGAPLRGEDSMRTAPSSRRRRRRRWSLGRLSLLPLLPLCFTCALALEPGQWDATAGPATAAAPGGGGGSEGGSAAAAAALPGEVEAASLSSPPPPGPSLLLLPLLPPPPPFSPSPAPPQQKGGGFEEEGNELGSWAAVAAPNATWDQPTLPPPEDPPTRPGPTRGAQKSSPPGSEGPEPVVAASAAGSSPPPLSSASPSGGLQERTLGIGSSSVPTALPVSPREEEEEKEEDDLAVYSGTDLFCNCSSVGSAGLSDCNSTTGQCECRTGYRGLHCDECEEGYYLEHGSGHCLGCGCHSEGSESLSCDNSGRCRCKAGAMGPKCTQCQEGYSRFNGTTCELCQCNNQSMKCDPWTGTCVDCQGNTEGASCEKCKRQFYRNGSQQHECLLCPCSYIASTGSCHIKPSHHIPTCDQCQAGYTGAHCNHCDNGYYSSDSLCIKCQCNGNVDPAQSPRVCKPNTGECLGCLYYTAGFHCEKCQEGYIKHSEDGNCTKKEYIPGPESRAPVPSAPNISVSTSSSITAINSTLPQTMLVQTVSPISPSDNSTSTLADVSWTQFNIIILTVIIILVVLLMGFVGAVYTYREYQNRKLNAPFWTIELKEDNISFSSYHDSIPNADVSGLLEEDGNEVAPNGQLTLTTPMHNYKA
ncbi:multiple epidermal growth factor-like domains protein 9 [Rhineura floridana]|uniref:multiple epidermal growth factor-like domains protein 9 n=1 Tax=Rhineura floridana TaxID=261503 RepID=UPI002AC88102|nr:multiple epidermal growth factor-like domains protein 9 [Rhineura floridana]